jgi:hypothetical protein
MRNNDDPIGDITQRERSDGQSAPAVKRNTSKMQPSPFKRFLNGLASAIKVVKLELLFGLVALILSLGQYFYSSINTRMTIANIWRDGYTSDIRNRVTKYRHLSKVWQERYALDNHELNPDETVRRLVYPKLLYSRDSPIQNDKHIAELVADEIALIRDRQPTNDDYINAALKYRNAIIECLNTMEAVKAVVEARPLPFDKDILYSNTLGGRYKDIIAETKDDLLSFIHHYREMTKGRETVAWFVLTNEESFRYHYFLAGALFLVLLVILFLVYLAKRYSRPAAKPPAYFIHHPSPQS